MNTYDLNVKGIKIFKNISQKYLQENLNLLRGIVWTSGGNDSDIEIIINKKSSHLAKNDLR